MIYLLILYTSSRNLCPNLKALERECWLRFAPSKFWGKIIIAFETYHPGGTQNGLFCRGVPYWRYISAEISAEILTILLIWCRKLSPPKIISVEYLSPPNIYLRRIYISAEYISLPNIYLRRNFSRFSFSSTKTQCIAVVYFKDLQIFSICT